MTQRYRITRKLHNGDMVYQCVGCKRVGADDLKAPVEYRLPRWAWDNMRISHGLCLDCFSYYKKEIEALKARAAEFDGRD